MKMKKILTVLLAAALTLLAATACSENSSGKSPSVSEIAAAVLAEVEIMSAVEKGVDEIGAYLDIDTSKVSELKYYICGSGAYPDELLIVKFTDKADVDKSGAEKRLASQIALYETYTPDEMYKLNSAVISTKGEYLFFYATADNDRVKEIIDSMF